eukprot:jgi/Psemu1/221195/e_gw1.1100.1.1
MPVVDGFVARTTVFPVARHDRPQQQQQQQQQNARVRSLHGLNTNTNANRIDTNGARQNQWLAAVPVPPTDDGDTVTTTSVVASFDDAVTNRYACTRYERYDGIYDASNRTPSPGNPRTIALAREALELACRAPTGFNVQPYKLLLVESPEAKAALSKFCIGRNKDRVLDSDCSVVFLADREAMRSWTDYRAMLLDDSNNNPSFATTKNKAKSRWAWLKLRALVALFSSGFPLPKILGGPISFAMRFAMRVVSWITRSRLVVPTLSSPECWSQKNTVLVAATYLLGCSARGLDTTPMEGYLSWGIRRSLKIPRRYTIPLVVSTGKAFAGGATAATASAASDDAGMAHGNTKETATPRFPIDTVVYENGFPS